MLAFLFFKVENIKPVSGIAESMQCWTLTSDGWSLKHFPNRAFARRWHWFLVSCRVQNLWSASLFLGEDSSVDPNVLYRTLPFSTWAVVWKTRKAPTRPLGDCDHLLIPQPAHHTLPSSFLSLSPPHCLSEWAVICLKASSITSLRL